MELSYQVKAWEAGFTAEKILRESLGLSRGMVRKLKKSGGVLVNGQAFYLNAHLQEGDTISVNLFVGGFTDILPQPIPIDIVYEDEHLLVANKPPQMLVHPLKHEPVNTLANAVLHHFIKSGAEPVCRPVTRLDRNTSGLVVVAKHRHAGFRLTRQLAAGELQREYLAVVHGLVAHPRGAVDLPVARCPHSKIKQMVAPGGRPALTNYYVDKYLKDKTLVKLYPKTGRTHQIRVHMSHLGHPLVGDTLYGGRIEGIARQALHCWRISLRHPVSSTVLELEAPLPADMERLIFEI